MVNDKVIKDPAEKAADQLLLDLLEMDVTLEQVVDTIDYAKDYARDQVKQFKIKK